MKKWHFIVAAIFLFNPILSTLDILPDFIGYLLLLKAFHNMSYIDDKAQDVCKGMKIMSIITVIKFFAFFLVPALDTTMYLVFSFVFAILEIIFGIGPIIKMFDCFSEYALLGENVDPANNSKIKIFSIGQPPYSSMLPDAVVTPSTRGRTLARNASTCSGHRPI